MRKLKFIFEKGVILLAVFMVIYLGVYIFARYKSKLPIESANKFYIYDTNDNLVNDLNDKWVSLDTISDHVKNATIAIEDKNFYKHSGFDYLRIIKSLYINAKSYLKIYFYHLKKLGKES